jgi:glycosyltransferase involved in cell wall biosynthesis
VNKVRVESTGPALNFSFPNAYAFAEAGASSHLLVQTAAGQGDEDSLYQRFAVPRRTNLRVHVYSERRPLGMKTNQWFYLWATRVLRRLKRKHGLDAVISRDPGALPYLVWLQKALRTTVFYQPHNFYVDLSLRTDVTPTNARKYQFLEKRFVAQMDGVFCLQDSQAALYRRYFDDVSIVAAPPGLVHRRVAARQVADREKCIAYVGSLQAKKGVSVLLDAFVSLANDGYRLLLVGGRDSGELEPVRRHVEHLGLSDLVTMTGWLPFAQVQEQLSKAAAGVLPLVDTFYNRYLTAPNKLFDYMSQGIPAIASDLPAIRDIAGSSGAVVFCRPEDPIALAETIRDVLEDRDGYLDRCREAEELAEQYLWRNRVQIMLDEILRT